jgi:DNA-directed RNA polymerase subunit RPC12/RpoP
MMLDEDTSNNAGVECPYCGHIHEDSWEWFQRGEEDDKEVECEGCEKVFFTSLRIMHIYLGRKPK